MTPYPTSLETERFPRGDLGSAAAQVDFFQPLLERELYLDRACCFLPASHLEAETLEAERARAIELRIVLLGAKAVTCLTRVTRGAEHRTRAAIRGAPDTRDARTRDSRMRTASFRCAGGFWGGPAVQFVERKLSGHSFLPHKRMHVV